MGKLTDKVAKGLFWVLMEKCGIQLSHFIVTLVLARLLTPNDYGTVALLSIFISLSNVFVDCGFGKALVQKKVATQVDYNSVFFLSMGIAAALYAALFAAAPWVASFYGIAELKPMLRVLALSLIFHSINGVQNVELNRKMLFHLSFRISWVCTGVSAVTGIAMASLGYGPWALVGASSLSGIAGVIARQLVIRWRPTCAFSWASLRELFRFGWRVTARALVNQFYADLQALLIGKFYTRADLAFVNKGRHVPRVLSSLIEASLRRVSFPALAKMQDDPVRLRNAMRRMIKCTTFCVFPLMVTLCVLAEPLVELLFGPRWLPAVPFMRVTSLSLLLIQFDTVNVQAMMARGRSDLVLGLTLLRRVMGIAVMAVTLRHGVLTFVATSALVIVPLGVFINGYPNRRHLGYTYAMQFGDVAGTVALTGLLAVLLWGTTFLPGLLHVRDLWLLPAQLAAAGVFYGGCALALRMAAVREIAKTLRPMATRRWGASSPVVRLLVWCLKPEACAR